MRLDDSFYLTRAGKSMSRSSGMRRGNGLQKYKIFSIFFHLVIVIVLIT